MPLKGSLNLDRFNFSISSADEKYGARGHGAGSASSKIPMTSEVRSENQSLLGAVEPLDWLFSADSEPEPPSSPKWVNKSLTEDIEDTRQELGVAAANKGAIPKRPRASATGPPNKNTSNVVTTSTEDLTKDEDYDRYSQFSIISTLSIKRTPLKICKTSLLNVHYNPKT